jgi:hypothetical protein
VSNSKIKTAAFYEKKLLSMKNKPPRLGVQPTVVIADKTKYKRRTKHPQDNEGE